MEAQAQEPGHGGVERTDPSRLRISDEDRHKVTEVLRLAAGEGRIDLDELDERIEATYAAKTYGDLVPITVDLPVAGGSATAAPAPRRVGPSAPVPAVSHGTSFAMMGDCSRRGVWEVPLRHTAFAMMGQVTLDLREARFAGREVVIDACAVMAGIDIVVNPSTQVVVEGFGVMGEFHERRSKVAAELTADSPVVRVRGLALMAGVRVQRKDLPGPPRKRLGLTR
ncbi:MAG: DUF1707 and DUF2154 domain-containing protein [Nocardioidaceae bacterium]|nr:DUF1707 and DUF2154 domain-containing protein [Nocardioidaceae bacterium]